MPGPISRIRFGSVLPKKARIKLCKTGPDPMWMAWSGFRQTHSVRKQAGMQESSIPVSGRTRPARYQFPSFRLGSVLPQTSRIILCKTSPGPIWFWLTVSGFGQTDPVRKQDGVPESLGLLRMRFISGIFTGLLSKHFALHPQKRGGLLGTGRRVGGVGEESEGLTARTVQEDRGGRGPPPEQWQC